MYGYNPYNYQQNYNYQQPTTDDRIWVQSEQSAEAYLVAPNSFVRLWNSAEPVFYEKRADASGRPLPMEAYTYTKKVSNASNTASLVAGPTVDYSEQIKGLEERIEALESMRRGGKNAKQSNADDTAV